MGREDRRSRRSRGGAESPCLLHGGGRRKSLRDPDLPLAQIRGIARDERASFNENLPSPSLLHTPEHATQQRTLLFLTTDKIERSTV